MSITVISRPATVAGIFNKNEYVLQCSSRAAIRIGFDNVIQYSSNNDALIYYPDANNRVRVDCAVLLHYFTPTTVSDIINNAGTTEHNVLRVRLRFGLQSDITGVLDSQQIVFIYGGENSNSEWNYAIVTNFSPYNDFYKNVKAYFLFNNIIMYFPFFHTDFIKIYGGSPSAIVDVSLQSKLSTYTTNIVFRELSINAITLIWRTMRGAILSWTFEKYEEYHVVSNNKRKKRYRLMQDNIIDKVFTGLMDLNTDGQTYFDVLNNTQKKIGSDVVMAKTKFGGADFFYNPVIVISQTPKRKMDNINFYFETVIELSNEY